MTRAGPQSCAVRFRLDVGKQGCGGQDGQGTSSLWPNPRTEQGGAEVLPLSHFCFHPSPELPAALGTPEPLEARRLGLRPAYREVPAPMLAPGQPPKIRAHGCSPSWQRSCHLCCRVDAWSPEVFSSTQDTAACACGWMWSQVRTGCASRKPT